MDEWLKMYSTFVAADEVGVDESLKQYDCFVYPSMESSVSSVEEVAA